MLLRLSLAGLTTIVYFASNAIAEPASPRAAREIFPGVATTRVVYGKPYALAGNRIVFTNWYYVNPGDLDWRDDSGKSVYVDGNSGLYEANHIPINAPTGIRLIAEKPTVVGPHEQPHRTILRDCNVYKGWSDSDYYESTDGMKWEKKAPLSRDEPFFDGPYHVFIDREAPDSERYKAVWVGLITRAEFDAYRQKRQEEDAWEPRAVFHLGERDEISCLRASVSPDGIAWKTLPEPIVVEYCDTFNTAYFDPVLRKYVLYTRYWSVGPTAEQVPVDIRNSWTDVGRRAIGRSESSDFSRFPVSDLILEPTPDMLPSESLYTNCHTTVPGAPDNHLMFPAIWNASVTDTTRIKMASSHDGRVWHWVPGGDILETQPFGQWDGGCIWALPEMIELPNGDWALPYMGHNIPHKYPRGQRGGGLGYAVWPKGRMVAVEANERGEFTVIPVIAPGQTIKINAVTERTGWVKVGVMGADKRGVDDCIPLVGDVAWAPVRWKDARDSGFDAGAAVTLRIELYRAKLYGIEFSAEPPVAN